MIEIRTGTALQHAAALQHLRTKLIGWEKVAGSLPISIPLRKVAGPKLLEQHVELDRSWEANILCCSAISIRFEARSRSPTHAFRTAGTASRIVLLRRLTRVVTLGRVHLAISAARAPTPPAAFKPNGNCCRVEQTATRAATALLCIKVLCEASY